MKKIRLKSRHKKTSLTCQRSRLLDLVDKNALKKLLNAFSNATGLRANIVDVEGKSIFGMADAQKNCKFCQLIWQLQHGVERCQAADGYAVDGSAAVQTVDSLMKNKYFVKKHNRRK